MDLNNLTPDEIASLKNQLNQTDSTGRSPIRPRQLHDLRLMPTATDPRPMFVWSAESPRDRGDLTRTTEFPKLMWHKSTGEEITVYTLEQQIEQGSIYTTQPPANPVTLDPMEQLQDALAGLSESDRALVLEEQRKQRISALQNKLAALSEDQLEALLNQSEPAKRRPGRPRKEVA